MGNFKISKKINKRPQNINLGYFNCNKIFANMNERDIFNNEPVKPDSPIDFLNPYEE